MSDPLLGDGGQHAGVPAGETQFLLTQRGPPNGEQPPPAGLFATKHAAAMYLQGAQHPSVLTLYRVEYTVNDAGEVVPTVDRVVVGPAR
jgi:hypothetical protein